MHHNVVREARVDHALRARKVAQEQSVVPLGVKRVCIRKRVRSDLKPMAGEAPANTASERELEASERAHHEGIRVVAMELWVLEDLLVGVRGERIGVVVRKPPWNVKHVVARVVVDDLYAIANGAGGERLAGDRHLRAHDSVADPERGITCDDRHQPFTRRRHDPHDASAQIADPAADALCGTRLTVAYSDRKSYSGDLFSDATATAQCDQSNVPVVQKGFAVV